MKQEAAIKQLCEQIREENNDLMELSSYLFNLSNEDVLNFDTIFEKIRNIFIEKYEMEPANVLKLLYDANVFNNHAGELYWMLCKLLLKEYPISIYKLRVFRGILCDNFNELFNKVIVNKSKYLAQDSDTIPREFKRLQKEELHRIVMNDDIVNFKEYILEHNFDSKKQYKLNDNYTSVSLLEECAYFGSPSIFYFLLYNCNCKITDICLELSFIGGNDDIINECCNVLSVNDRCLENAIRSHNNVLIPKMLEFNNVQIDPESVIDSMNISIMLQQIEENPINIIYYLPGFPIQKFSAKIFDIVAMNFDINSDILFVKSLYYNNVKLAEHLLPNVKDIEISDDTNGKKAIHYASYFNQKELVEKLIKRGANVNSRDSTGRTPLHDAASTNARDSAELLLDNGADFNIVDNFYGAKPLHIAANKNSKETAELLIRKGCDVDTKDDISMLTPLHYTIEYNCKETAKFLIEEGADVNAKDFEGNTALYKSAEHGKTDMVEFFIKNGADYKAKNDDGSSLLHALLSMNNKSSAEYLMTLGLDVNAKNLLGKTPLHIAVESFDRPYVEILLKYGADVNGKDFNGITPLQIASWKGDEELADILISHGAIYA